MIDDSNIIAAAGTGSYDGYQETAHRPLLARATARRAAELYPDGSGPPGSDYRAGTEADVDAANAALRLPPGCMRP